MMRGFCAALVVLTVCASAANAQRTHVYVTEPSVWISGGAGGFTAEQVNDGNSASTWDFGHSTNWQWAAGAEKNIGGGSSLGVAATYAHTPFAYVGFGVPNTSGATCARCDAHMDLTTLVGTFHFGAGAGFHQTIQFDGGIVNYANLKRDADGVRLAGGNNTDPFFTIGYGLGYGFDERMQLEFIPVWGIAIHERSGLSNGVSNTNSIRSLRVAFRMGFGGATHRTR